VAAGISSSVCLTQPCVPGGTRSYPYNLDFDFGPLEGLLKCVKLPQSGGNRTPTPPSADFGFVTTTITGIASTTWVTRS
jgi:hypothetical protein